MLRKWLYRRIGKKFITQKAKANLNDIHKEIITLMNDFLHQAESLSEEQLNRKREEAKWSGKEVIYHATDVGKSVFRLVSKMDKGDSLQDVDRRAVGKTKLLNKEELVIHCKEALNAAQSATLAPAENNVTCGHPFFGQMNRRQWLAMNLIHLQRHFKQLKRSLE